MKTLLFCIASVFSLLAHAQITKVSLQASGLTCSMCSNSINKSLQTIDFVAQVHPNVQTSTFNISFKPGSYVDFDKIKKKVEDAGFTVANFVATIHFDNLQIKDDQPVKLDDKTFYFLHPKEQSLNGEQQVRIVDKGFISGKEYKKNAARITNSGKGIYNVTI